MGVWGQNLPGLALSYISVLNFLTEGLISQEWLCCIHALQPQLDRWKWQVYLFV